MSDKPRIRVENDSTYHLDAWQNLASGMGVTGVDRTIATRYTWAGSSIDWRTLGYMYRYDWLARKICERPAKDATRRWLRVNGDNGDRIMADLDRLCFRTRAKQAISWARVYGGAAILLIVEDGRRPEQPLDPSEVRRVVDLKVVDRHHLTTVGASMDVYSINFGRPEFYQTTNGTLFHHSRVMKFTGADLTQDDAEVNSYWGGSMLELYQDAVKWFQGSMQDVRHSMSEHSVPVLSIPGLANAAAHGGNIYDAVRKRLNEFNANKSVYRAAAIDKEEEFAYVARTLTGLENLLDRFMTTVAGATDMGQLVLFGTSPSGLNASQEEQLAVYYDMVRDLQEDELRPAVDTVLSCLSGGDVPDWAFVPLMEPTDQQMAETRNSEAQAVSAVADLADLSPEEIRAHLNRTGTFDLPEFNGFSEPDGEGMPPDE